MNQTMLLRRLPAHVNAVFARIGFILQAARRLPKLLAVTCVHPLLYRV